MVEARMGLAADLAKAVRLEIAKIGGQRDADAEGQSGSAGGAGVAFGSAEKTAGDLVTAELRVYGQAAQIEVVALTGRQHAAD